MPTVLATHTPELFETAVQRAVSLLKSGEVVGLPTETVYGLAANALDARAVTKIFEIKGRPANNPIIVHVASVKMAKQCASTWSDIADKLARAFWPGPLTIVLRKAESIPPIVTAGGQTVGIRWPSHPLIQAVIQSCGFPLAAPSANLSGQISPTTAEHVEKVLGQKVSLIIDGGPSQVGIESTVSDLSVSPPTVLRPGVIHEESLAAVIGELAGPETASSGTLKSPGMLPRHYAPKAKLIALNWGDDRDLRGQVLRRNKSLARCQVIAHSVIPSAEGFQSVSVIPHDPEAFARAIYAELHRCDEAGAELIVVESVPESGEWKAVADRLNRAATV